MKKYAEQDYTAAVLPQLADDFPFPAVQTRCKYFPTIVLVPSDTEPLYGAAMVVCKDTRALYSPSILKQLANMGFVFDKQRTILLPTYVNKELGVMVQIDDGNVSGVMCVSFSPIEDFKSASVPMARRLKR